MGGASPDDGNAVLHTPGKDPAPPLHYNGRAEPHPIISATDVLSSGVSIATNIMTQVTLTDGNGNTVYTGIPVYYSPAGYTAGQTVKFAQMVDASALADGRYYWNLMVTENYPSGIPALRSYNGIVEVRNLDQSPYGKGWMLAKVDHLYPQPDGVNLADGSGNMYFFANTSPPGMAPSFQAPDLVAGRLSLAQNPDGSYTLTANDGSSTLFSSTGLMTSQKDANGNTTSYTFNVDGTLASETDQSGRTTAYGYTSGLLTSVTDFAGRVTSYAYTGGQLTSISEPNPGHGETASTTTIVYDPATGLVSTITDSTGTTTYAYDKWRSVTRITNPDGTYKQFATPADQGVVDTSTGVGTPANPAPLFYASQVNGTQTDENGRVSPYVTGRYGNFTSSTDAVGNTTTFQYNDAGQVTQMTQPPLTPGGANLVTTYTYDANGNLIQENLPDGTHETWNYDPTFNKVTKFVDPAGRETDYSINASNGNVMSMTHVSLSGNLVTSYTYTPAPTLSTDPPGGLVATVTDPRGIVTAITYNHHGLPTTIVYAQATIDQASVSFTYDANDNPATYTDELGRVTSFVYDNMNRLVQTTLPPPDPANPTVRPVISDLFNPQGHKISETDPLGDLTQWFYGAFGNLIKTQQPDPAGGVNYTITQYGHDAAGNLTTITDPMSRITTLGYDADNRQTSVQLPNPAGGGTGGPTKSVVYDALGDVVKSFDFKGAETDYTYDAMGRVLTITAPPPTTGAARPVTSYTYNADGQVLTETDPMGHVTSFAYDDFGRLTQETLPDPDGAGPLTSSVLHWAYDADGNLASKTDGLSHTTT